MTSRRALLLVPVLFAAAAGGQSPDGRPRSALNGASVVLGSVLAVDSAGALLVRGRYVAASTRGSIGVGAKGECFMSVYVDGLRIYPAGRAPPPSLDDYITDDVEAIEIYSGPARVPLEYRGTGSGACGVIAIWRRNG